VDGDIEALPGSNFFDAHKWAPVFDFDTDSPYPSPAISPEGVVNKGLKIGGSITGECRDPEQLINSNTYHRSASIYKDGNLYTVHMYALYFQKDQKGHGAPGKGTTGHRHDWEFALVWTKNGQLTHASTSAHGKVYTDPRSRLPVEADRPDTVKVVYHKEGGQTHAFRFAKKNETAENHLRRWVTPTLVNWHTMTGNGVSNHQLRETLNRHDFINANCSVADKNFFREIAKNPPATEGYPKGSEWKALGNS
jgi:hypothetical protein